MGMIGYAKAAERWRGYFVCLPQRFGMLAIVSVSADSADDSHRGELPQLVHVNTMS